MNNHPELSNCKRTSHQQRLQGKLTPVAVVALFLVASLPTLADTATDDQQEIPDVLVRNDDRVTRNQAAAEIQHSPDGIRITPRGHDGDLLVEKVWLDEHIDDLASDREFTVTTFEEREWVTIDIRGRGHTPVILKSFTADNDPWFTQGSTQSIELLHRPMFVQVLSTHRTVADPNGTVPDREEALLAVEFTDGNTAGQPLVYNAEWLAALDLHVPSFVHEDGSRISSRFLDGAYHVYPTHFSIIYTFNTAEGFAREADRFYSHIWWDSGSQTITLKQDKRDSLDELFSKPLPSPFTHTQGGEVRAMHTVTTHGYHQSHIPLFLAASGVTDVNTHANSAFFYYQGGASSSAGTLFMRIRDPNGALVYDASASAPSGIERELGIQYVGDGTYIFTIADHSQEYFVNYQAEVLVEESNIRYDKWGAATNGWAGAATNVQYATVDNMLLRYGGTSGSDDNPICLDTGTDAGGYACNRVPYNKQTMSGATSLSLGLDGMSSTIALPFSFEWYAAAKSHVRVSANGFITFDTSLGGGHWVSQNVPDTADPNDLIACGWEDLDSRKYDGFTGSTIQYGTYGSSPNRKFVVDYYNIYHNDDHPTSYMGSGNHFQIQLQENGDAYCMLGDIVDDTDGVSMLVGTQNAAGTAGSRYIYGEAGVRNRGVYFQYVNNDPYQPINSGPTDGEPGVAWSPTLSWSSNGDPDGDAVMYTVRGTISGGSYSTICTTTTMSCAWNGLERGATYWWYVQASDGKGGSAQSTATSFTTTPNQVPTVCLSLIATYLDVEATSSCTDPDGDPVEYKFSWGDGEETTVSATTASTVVRPHLYGGYSYCPSGTATVTLEAKDAYGGTASETTSLAISDTGHEADSDGLVDCRERIQGTVDALGMEDSDRDGLDDYFESEWYDYAQHVSIFCGAQECAFPSPAIPDLYVEVDWMLRPDRTCAFGICLDPGYPTQPSATQINPVVAAFATQGINAHFDTGQLGGGNQIPYRQELQFVGEAGVVDFYDHKLGGDGITRQMETNRVGVYHYLISGDRYAEKPRSSGVAGVQDDDVFISYAFIRDNLDDFARATEGLDMAIAGTIIHEVGHNLCLSRNATHIPEACRFSGIDTDGHVDYESSMSYWYQMNMVDYSDGSNGANDHDDWTPITLNEFRRFADYAHGGEVEPPTGPLPPLARGITIEESIRLTQSLTPHADHP